MAIIMTSCYPINIACQKLCEVRGDSSKSLQTLSSAKLALQGIITKTKVTVNGHVDYSK